MTKNIRKFLLLQYIYSQASMRDFQVTEASSLQKEHPALQIMNFLQFYLFLLVIFTCLDPDPDTGLETQLNLYPIRKRNTG
jgi:hypothetical protein